MGISIPHHLSAAGLFQVVSDSMCELPKAFAASLYAISTKPALFDISPVRQNQAAEQTWACEDIFCAWLLLADKSDSPAHPQLQENLRAVISQRLVQLTDDPSVFPDIARKILPHLFESRRWPKELTVQEREELLDDAPYTRNDVLTNFIYNSISYFQAQIVSKSLGLEAKETPPHLKKWMSRTMSPEAVQQKLAALEASMRQAEADAWASGFGVRLQSLNQALYRHEWGIQIPARFVQGVAGQALHRFIPGLGLVEVFRNAVQENRMPAILPSDLSETFLQVSGANTFSELLGALNGAVEKNLLTPLGIIHALMSLASGPGLLLPVTLALGAAASAGKERFSTWLAAHMGTPSLEGAKALQELVRLSNNCGTLKHYATGISSLLRSGDDRQDPAVRGARVLLGAVEEVQSILSFNEEPEIAAAFTAKWTAELEQLRMQAPIHAATRFRIDVLKAAKVLLGKGAGSLAELRAGLPDLRDREVALLAQKGVPVQEPLWDVGAGSKERLTREEKKIRIQAALHRGTDWVADSQVQSGAAFERSGYPDSTASGTDTQAQSVIVTLMGSLGLGRIGMQMLGDVRNVEDIEMGAGFLSETSVTVSQDSSSNTAPLIAQSVQAVAATRVSIPAILAMVKREPVLPLLSLGAGVAFWLISRYFAPSTDIRTVTTAAGETVGYLNRQCDSDGVSLWSKFQDIYSYDPDSLRSAVEEQLSENDFKELSAIQVKNHLAAATFKAAEGGGERVLTPSELHYNLPEGLPLEAAQNLVRQASRAGRRTENTFGTPRAFPDEGLNRMLAKHGYPSAGEARAGYFDQMAATDGGVNDIQNSLVGWVVNLVRATQANPCENFHDYANTDLLSNQGIPRDGEASTRYELRRVAELEGVGELIKQAWTWSASSPAAYTVDALYRSGMSDETIRLGDSFWQARVRTIDELASCDAVFAYLIEGIRQGRALGFDLSPEKPRIIGLVANEPEIKDASDPEDVAQFRAQVKETLQHSGMLPEEARVQASGVAAIEAGLTTGMGIRFLTAADAEATAADAGGETVAFPFRRLAAEFGQDPNEKLAIYPIERFHSLQSLLGEQCVESWRAWLRYKEYRLAEPFLASEVDKVPSAQRGAQIRNLIDNEESDIASWAVGDLYREQRFPPEAQAMFYEVQNHTVAALHQFIDESRFSDMGKQRLHDKLAAAQVSVALPSGVPYDTSAFSATASFLSNVEAAKAQLRKFHLEWVRTPRQERRIDFDGAAYGQHRHPVAGSYSTESNEVTISLIGLRSFIGPDMQRSDRASWYGTAGFMLGHELMHLILTDYPELDAEDQAQLDNPLRELALAYGEMELEPGLTVNGNRTSRENFADLMGLDLAYRAMSNAVAGEPGPMHDRRSDNERFFWVYGRTLGGVSTPAYLASRLRWDPHAPFSVRANAARHQLAFTQTFNCPAPDFEVGSLAVRLSGNVPPRNAPTEPSYAVAGNSTLDAGELKIISGLQIIDSEKGSEDLWQRIWDISHDESQSDSRKVGAVEHLLAGANVRPDFYEKLASLRSAEATTRAAEPYASAPLGRHKRDTAGPSGEPVSQTPSSQAASSSSRAAAALVRLALRAQRHYTTEGLAQADQIFRGFHNTIEELKRIPSEDGCYDLVNNTITPEKESDFGKLVANCSVRFQEILQSQPRRDQKFRVNLANEGLTGSPNLDPDHLLITKEGQYKARQLDGDEYYPVKTVEFFKASWIPAENSEAENELKSMARELGGELRYDGTVNLYALLTLNYNLPIAPTASGREVADAVRSLELMRDERLQRILAASHGVGHGSSDYPIMRHQLAKLLQSEASGPFSIKEVWVRPGQDSPFYDFSKDLAYELTELQQALRSLNSSKRTQDDLLVSWLKKLDLTKPFDLQVKYTAGGRLQYVRVEGLGKNRKPSVRNIPAGRFQAWSSHDFNRFEAAGKTEAAWMPVNMYGEVPLAELIRYYGVRGNSADFGSLSKEHLSLIIGGLYQKRELIGRTADRVLNPITPDHIAFVLVPGVTNRLSLDFQENNVDDYEVIRRRTRNGMRGLWMQFVQSVKSQKHFGASELKIQKALLTGLRRAGGVTVKLRLQDTDGIDHIYKLRHRINTEQGLSLKNYFEDAAEEVGEYFVSKIKEQEGDRIKIRELSLEIITPHLKSRSYGLTEQEIEVFAIRSPMPPFRPLDPLEQGGYEAIQSKMEGIGEELAMGDGAAARSNALYAAAKEYRRLHDVTWFSALSEVSKIYYRAISSNLEERQRSLVMKQPNQAEFVARSLCRYIGIDESKWAKLSSTPIRMKWTEKFLFRVWSRDANRSLLDMLYDEALRKEIAGSASDKDDVVRQIADAIRSMVGNGEIAGLEDKIHNFFTIEVSFSDPYAMLVHPPHNVSDYVSHHPLDIPLDSGFNAVVDILGPQSISNSELPSELRNPVSAYTEANKEYAKNATRKFRDFEVERILLTADDSVSRMESYSKELGGEALLTREEKYQLGERQIVFEKFLLDRANVDDFRAMSTTMDHLLEKLRWETQFIPVLGNAISLACDAWRDDESQEAQDVLFLFLDLISLKGGEVLRTLASIGTESLTIKGALEDLKNFVLANNAEEAKRSLSRLSIGFYQVLEGGRGIVKHLKEAAQHWDKAENPTEVPSGEGLKPIAFGDLQSSRYWLVDHNGQISERPGRTVRVGDWNGDAILEGGARAIRLGDARQVTYMLDGVPYWKTIGSEGTELRRVAELDLQAGQWTQLPGTRVNEFTRFSQSNTFPSDFAGRPERSQSMANTVAWYDNCHSILESVSLVERDVGATEYIGVVDHKYVTAKEGQLVILEHFETQKDKTTFLRQDGSSFEVNAELPATPRYNVEVDVKIVGAEGMFVTVEITNTVEGLISKRVVSGVVAPAKSGGQELVLGADHGVHYRAVIPRGQELSLVPGETASDQQPIKLKAKMISPDADPKRASPSLWRNDHVYKEGMAHDDFALELYYGAKAANEAGSSNSEQVEGYVNAIKKLKSTLPQGMRDVFNPYYVLSTSEEHAILFAPRNQARLAGTLLEETVIWGEVSHPKDVNFVERILKCISVLNASGEHRSALLGSVAEFPSGSEARTELREGVKERLRKNLLLAEVLTEDGQPVYFVDSHGESGVYVNNNSEDIRICSGELMDDIEAEFPDPRGVKEIRVFSLDDIPEEGIRRIFRSSQRGYTYISVTSLEAPRSERPIDVEAYFDVPNHQYGERIRSIGIPNAEVDLTEARYIESGPQIGSYLLGERYYVKLDNNLLYLAEWDWQQSSFKLVPTDASELANSAKYPLVRHVGGGEFVLRNRPGLKGGVKEWKEPGSIQRKEVRQEKVNGKLVYVGKKPLLSKGYGENRYAAYKETGEEGASELKFEGTYLERTDTDDYRVAPESDVQQIWSSKYWDIRVAASKVRPKAGPAAKKGGRKLVDVVRLAPELQKKLEAAGEAKIPQRLKVYRSMPETEAAAILKWAEKIQDKNSKVIELAHETSGAKIADEVKNKGNLVIEIGGHSNKKSVAHLGGLKQALKYKGTTLEFILKPGAVDVLLNPENDYVAMRQEGGVLPKVAVATKKGTADYPAPESSQGGMPGYIGLKPESPKGVGDTFSIGLGGDPARLLFQLFVEEIRRYPEPESAANEQGSHRHKRMLPSLREFFWRSIRN